MANRGEALTVTYTAYNRATGAQTTGDAGNHALRWLKDGVKVTPAGTPGEIDSAECPGEYRLALTTAETDCKFGTLTGKSSTANVVIVPVKVDFLSIPQLVSQAMGSQGETISSPTSYATPADLLRRYDARRVGELLLDIGERAEAEAIKSGAGLPADSVVQSFLDDASGALEAFALMGQRYDPADLLALTNVSKKFLISLVCDLAMWGLLCRRKADTPPTPRALMAAEHLKALQEGREVFGVRANVEAGLPSHAPPLTEENLNDLALATTTSRRMFGQRGDSVRAGRQR